MAVRDSSGTDLLVDSIYYDAQGRISWFSGFQFLNNAWLNVYKVYYAYDANGNLVQRTNFNSFGTDEFTQGGVYDYRFDEQNRPTGHTAYFGDYEDIFEEAEYLYDAEGRRYMDVMLQGFGSVDSSLKILYTYDANDRLISKVYYTYDGFGWDEYNSEVFEYDYAGNCIDHSTKDNTGSYTSRRLYEYNEVGASDVSMPYYFTELGYPEAFDDANMRVLEHFYSLDADFVLQYICDYYYIYNDLPWGVESYDAVNVLVGPNPTSNYCQLRAAEMPISQVLVYDLFGRLIETMNVNDYNCTLDLTDVPAGVYMVKIALENGQTSVKKIVKE